MAADFLEETRSEIEGRLKELRPLVAEYHRLEAAAAALEGVTARSAAPQRAARRPKARATAAGQKAARRRGAGGKRADEALAIVRATPGLTVSQIADKLGIKQNYLYRVLPSLAASGFMTKEGRSWHPVPTS